MTSKLKEDERNEKLIRGLLKLPGNRKCINCNVKGPQYVCTTFSTFVCAICSGIHREFSHRVKSVSMAKFTPEEIASLQAGTNERAKEFFFKDLDSQRVKAPDNSNVDKLRTFIKHVYVDRRYTGQNSTDKPPRPKMDDKEEPNENRRSDQCKNDSRSPPRDNGHRYSERPIFGHDVRGIPGNDQENTRHSNYGRTPVHSAKTAIVVDWRRENRFAKGKKPDDGRSSDREIKPEISALDSQNDSSTSSLSAVRPVGDLLGEDVVSLQVSEPPAEGAGITEKTATSSALTSRNDNPTEVKQEISLIDFDDLSEPVVPAPAPLSGMTIDGDAPTPSNGVFPSSSNSDFLSDSPGGTLTTDILGGSAFPSGLSSRAMTGALVVHASHAVTQAPQTIPAPAAQTLEVNGSKSQELPMDLFTATYSPTPYQGPAWQTGVPPGNPQQYNTMMSMPTYPQPNNLSNPFNGNAEAALPQVAAFPSMTSLHAALPDMAVQGGSMHSSNYGGARPSWMPPHPSSYPSAVHPPGSSFRPAMQGAYMGQQLHSNIPPSRPQGIESFGNQATLFGALNPVAPTPSPSLGGNPFG